MYGPLEYVLFQFEDDLFIDKILPELIKINQQDCVQVVDLTFIIKDVDGSLEIVEVSELDDEDALQFDPIFSDSFALMTVEDVELVASQLPDNSTGAVLLLEHRWGEGLKGAVHAAGGMVLDSAYINPQTQVEFLVGMEYLEVENA
jgi:hypothetical protein